MNNHTPGPWLIEEGEFAVYVFAGIEAQGNYRVLTGLSTNHKSSVADAKLIAAAPDMLEALQAAIALSDKYYGEQLEQYETIERTPECQAVYDKVNAAIEKATI